MSDLPPPPPYPSSGSYGAPEPADEWSPSHAIGVGFRTFREHWAPFIGIALITLVVTGVIGGLGGSDQYSLRYVVFHLIAQVLGLILGAAQTKGAIDAVDGREVAIGTMFEGWDKLNVVVAAVLVSIATVIGFVLLVIPGLVVLFLTFYTQFFVVDRGASPVQAIKDSASFTSKHVGPFLVLALLSILVLILGLICLVVGLLVAFPTVLIAAAYTYRRLGPPAPATV